MGKEAKSHARKPWYVALGNEAAPVGGSGANDEKDRLDLITLVIHDRGCN